MQMTSRQPSSPTFVGRRDELLSLLDAFAGAAAGEPGAVLIGGEAGVGKTRLLTEFVSDLPEPAKVVWGRCMALVEGGLPFGAFREGLRTLVRSLDRASLEELRSHTSAELAHLIPDLSDGRPLPDPGDRSAEQSRMFEQLLQTIAFLATRRPLVFVIDDLHWADRSTLTLLAFLMQNLTTERVLICATYRSDELAREHPLRMWLAERLRQRERSIELHRLSRSETTAQLEAILDLAPPEDLIEEIFARSGGNPFFAEELLVASADSRSEELPTSVRELLLTRLTRLSSACQKLLRAASASRTPIDPWVLSRVAGTHEEDLFEPLRESVDNHVLEGDRDGRRFVFRHALLREAIYSDVLPGERQRLHRSFAEAIESARTEGRVDTDEALPELAFHRHGSGDHRRAICASLAAASAAAGARGFDNALDHFDNVLELWERVPDAAELTGSDHSDVLARAARVANLAGDDERAISLVRGALEETDVGVDPMATALLYESLGRYLFENGEPAAALDAFESALALSSDATDRIERARILAMGGRLHMQRGHHERALGFCEEALELARRLGAREEEGRALNPLGVMLATEGRFEEGIAHLRRALEIAEEVGEVEELASAYVNLGFALDISGRLREAIDLSLQGAERAHEWGLAQTWGVLLRANAAEALFELGDWTEMRSLIDTAGRSARSRFDHGFVHLSAARLDAMQGDFASSHEHLGEVKDLFGDGSHLDFLRGLREVTADLALWERRPDDARSAALDGLDALAGTVEHILAGRFLILALRAHADLAENARDRHSRPDEEAAVEGARRVLATAETFERNPLDPTRSPLPESAALQAQAAAELARGEGRHEPERWEAAAVRWEELERPYQAAYSRWRGAEAALLAKVSGPRASEDLRAAHETATRLGARPLLSEIELLARRARIEIDAVAADEGPVPEVAPWEHFGLTEREVEVIRYLADGLSNRDIARRLFISPKTASAHVSNILRKLGVQGRVEAAAVAFRVGLVPDAQSSPPAPDGA
jgi:ATP/maltotriose-dependent transcriptional regulator MalT